MDINKAKGKKPGCDIHMYAKDAIQDIIEKQHMTNDHFLYVAANKCRVNGRKSTDFTYLLKMDTGLNNINAIQKAILERSMLKKYVKNVISFLQILTFV